MPTFAIIIPCYNEATRLQPAKFIEFAATHADARLIFVNDGSSDDTKEMLHQICQQAPGARFISLSHNSGKGEAVRQGMLSSFQQMPDYIGYLDADLSTSLEEIYRLHEIAFQHNDDMVLGSRIKKIDTIIERSFSRHLIGRTLATLIDSKFKFGIYDTQCGAKIFKPGILNNVIDRPFYTRWFFDVELLCRIRQQHKDVRSEEIPLKEWRNTKNSRIGFTSFPAVMKELILLFNKY